MEDKQDILLEIGTNELEVAEFGIFLKDDDTVCQSFGINVAKVREIIKVPPITKIPDTHQNIMGIFKLRNKTIPLIDLGRCLNEKVDIPLEKCFVIVTEFNKNNFGFLIHHIENIHRMSWERILPPVGNEVGFQTDYVTGIIPFDKKILMMIDFEKIVGEINPKFSVGNIDNIEVDESVKGMTVVIADDSSLIRKMVTDILEKGGFEVIPFINGKVAWDFLNKLIKNSKEKNKLPKETIQLVITDIEMPQMDGHSLCKNIKDCNDLDGIPVILYSSLIYDEIRKKGEKLGADAQLSKPEFGGLVKIAKKLVNKKN
jgi:two-component system chemotaxis response regulator CheV